MNEHEMDHLTKEPTRTVCYHGSAVFGMENLATGERRISVRVFGHTPVEDENEDMPEVDSERIEILLTGEEALEFMMGIIAGYEGVYGPLPYGGSPN